MKQITFVSIARSTFIKKCNSVENFVTLKSIKIIHVWRFFDVSQGIEQIRVIPTLNLFCQILALPTVFCFVIRRQQPAHANFQVGDLHEQPQKTELPVITHIPEILNLHRLRPQPVLLGKATRNILFWDNPNFGFFGAPAEIWRTNLSSLFPEFYDAALQQLISARRKARMTQMAVAQALGRPQSFVSKYESGERALDFAEFIIIARIVGVDPYKILRAAEAVKDQPP